MMNTSISCIFRVNVNMTHKRDGMEWVDRRNSLIDCKYMCVIPYWFQNAHLHQHRWATNAGMRPWKWPSYFCTLILTRESLKMQSLHRKEEGVKRRLVRCFVALSLMVALFYLATGVIDVWWLASRALLSTRLLRRTREVHNWQCIKFCAAVDVIFYLFFFVEMVLCCILYCMLHDA